MTAITASQPKQESKYSFPQAKQFIFRWTPRAFVACIGGYYSLGVAYEYGIMASIDKIAIPIIKNHVGYIGLGAAMPTFQWYSAWAVRVSAAVTSSFLYDLTLRILNYLKSFLLSNKRIV